jgi:DtxR family Mn-dependent transcriptional regulator
MAGSTDLYSEKTEILSRELEEYLESLYILTNVNKNPAKTTDLAKRLGIAPSSVTEMLQRLDRKNLAKYSRYEGTILTKRGLELGREVVRKHRLLERFLYDFLKIKKERVHEQACQLEHDLSEEAEEALCRILKFPEECPDDRMPIPPCSKDVTSCVECQKKDPDVRRLKEKELTSLIEIKENSKGKVAFIRGGKAIVQRLFEMGLTPGTEIEVLKFVPFNGSIEVNARDSKLVISRRLAKKIFLA